MRIHRIMAATAVVAAIGGAAAPGSAQAGRLADFTFGLTTGATSAPSGLTVHILFHRANDPNAKPSPIRAGVFQGPSGLRFDTSAVPQCTASDDQIRVLGSSACPADSQLTVGTLTAMTGFGPPVDPLAGEDHVFNGPNQFIEIITAPGTPASPGFDRLSIQGSTLSAHPPATPGGPPDGQTAVRSIDFRIPVRVSGDRPLITTPPDCPPGGQWTSTARLQFADGSTDTVDSQTPCATRPAPAASPPRAGAPTSGSPHVRQRRARRRHRVRAHRLRRRHHRRHPASARR